MTAHTQSPLHSLQKGWCSYTQLEGKIVHLFLRACPELAKGFYLRTCLFRYSRFFLKAKKGETILNNPIARLAGQLHLLVLANIIKQCVVCCEWGLFSPRCKCSCNTRLIYKSRAVLNTLKEVSRQSAGGCNALGGSLGSSGYLLLHTAN